MINIIRADKCSLHIEHESSSQVRAETTGLQGQTTGKQAGANDSLLNPQIQEMDLQQRLPSPSYNSTCNSVDTSFKSEEHLQVLKSISIPPKHACMFSKREKQDKIPLKHMPKGSICLVQ